jgi:hypothetical protein
MRERKRFMSSTVVGTRTRFNPFNGSTTSSTSIKDLEKSEVCRDVVSPRPYVQANPLSLVRNKEGAVIVQGTVTHAFLGFLVNIERFRNYPISTLVPSFGTESLVPMYSYTSEALARAIPSASQTDGSESLLSLPELVLSAKSLQKAFFDLKRLKFSANTIGAAYLANEWGIKPLISDLQLLLTIGNQLSQSSKDYNSAERGKSFKGRLRSVESSSKSREWFTTLYSAHSFDVLNEYKCEVWYSIRFRPNGNLAPSTTARFLEIFGFSRPLETLWNLVPWSFLVDYIVDVSDFISSRNSSHRVRDICIMRHQLAKASVDRKSSDYYNFGLQSLKDSSLSFTGRPSITETKARSVFADAYGVPLKPFLSGKALTNIAALLAANSGK